MKNTCRETHDFYCSKCGEKIYSLPRKTSHKYQKHHMKKLWCWKCHQELNCIECRTDEEVKEFKAKWKNGDYQEEVQKSIEFFNNPKNNIWS